MDKHSALEAFAKEAYEAYMTAIINDDPDLAGLLEANPYEEITDDEKRAWRAVVMTISRSTK